DNRERKRREKIQQATFESSEAVHTTEDLPSLYRQIHTIIQRLMPAKTFYIALADSDHGTISFDYYVDERMPKPPPQQMNSGLTSLVLRTGKPLLIGRDDEARKKRIGREVQIEGVAETPYVECGAPAAIWLGVPLLRQNHTFGVL